MTSPEKSVDSDDETSEPPITTQDFANGLPGWGDHWRMGFPDGVTTWGWASGMEQPPGDGILGWSDLKADAFPR
ncbi:hypothetical protein J6590_053432 [Homalodisca vitripennis]|nr:hypothetical protein J6590_053432 [Homalodisca vitripennis]